MQSEQVVKAAKYLIQVEKGGSLFSNFIRHVFQLTILLIYIEIVLFVCMLHLVCILLSKMFFLRSIFQRNRFHLATKEKSLEKKNHLEINV